MTFVRFLFLLIIFIAFRYEFLFSTEHSLKLWDSDNAIMGLMADQIYRGEGFPIFFWGQEYLGPLTSWIAPLIQLFIEVILPKSDIANSTFAVHPQTMVLSCALVSFLGFWLLSEFFCRQVNIISGLIFGAVLSVSGSVIFSLTLRPLGHEAIFLCAGILLWAYVYLKDELFSRKRQFVFGLALSFCYWVHHGSFLILAAIALIWLIDNINLVLSWKPVDIALLRESRPSAKLPRLATLAVLSLLYLRIGTGLFIDLFDTPLDTSLFGLGIRASNGVKIIKSSLAPLLMIYGFYYGLRSASFRTLVTENIKRFYPIALGFFLLRLPVIIGKALGLYESSYTFSPSLASWDQILRLDILIGDFIPKLLAPNSSPVFSMVMFLTIIALSLYSLQVGPKQRPLLPRVLWALIFINLGIIMATNQYYERYGLLVVVSLAGLAACLNLSQKKPALLKLGISIMLIATLLIDAQGFKKGLHHAILPLAEVDKLKSETCQIYYADYWDAYRLEYLSGGDLKFIPWQSQDRSPGQSAMRAKQTDDRCWYLNGVATRKKPSQKTL